MRNELNATIVLPSGNEVIVRVVDLDFKPPFGDDIAGHLTACVVIEGDMLEDNHVRRFEGSVYDGEVESFEHVDQIDWQRWYRDEDQMPKIEDIDLEGRARSCAADLINREVDLSEGVPDEEDVRLKLIDCMADYDLEREPKIECTDERESAT